MVDNLEQRLKTSTLRFNDTLLENYLHGIVCRLAQAYCNDVRIYVVRTPHFNASMAPNGMMQVWSGLLIRAQNEAQLAAVLGHELAHYLRKHSLQEFESIRKKATFANVAAIALGASASSGGIDPVVATAGMTIGNLVLVASVFSYSRSAEYEADKFGIQLLADAEYDVTEASAIWKRVIDEEEAADKKRKKQWHFLSSHPSPKNRFEKLGEYAHELGGDGSKRSLRDPVAFQSAVDPYLPELIQDQINLGDFGRTELVLKAIVEAGRSPALVNFYHGELYRKRNGDGDIARAIDFYEQSLEGENPPPEAYRALGMIKLKNKNLESAQKYFGEYLAVSPEAPDREMIEYYLRMAQ